MVDRLHMKIRKLRIENFRGLSQVEFDLEKPMSVIVGPNAVGKTTVLEAVRLAKALLNLTNLSRRKYTLFWSLRIQDCALLKLRAGRTTR